ncbi:MAG: ATP-binding cassette domain-containing protein [Candidatus Berkiella sp.]
MPNSLTFGSLTKDLKQVYSLFKPYFGLDAKNRWRSMAVIVLLAGCLTASITMVYIQNAGVAFSALILTPGVTFSAFGWALAGCLVPIVCYATIISFCALVTSWLSDNLSYELGSSLIAKWIDKKAFYGIKFIHSKDNKINPAVVLGDDLNEICKSSTTLASSFTQAFLDFTVGAYQLYLLSVPLVFTIFSITMTIPGYMVIGALTYASIYGLVVHLIDSNLTQVETQLKNKKDSFNKQLSHVEEHAETVAMKMGNNREKQRILHKLEKFSFINASKRWINFLLAFVQSISMNVSYMFGLALTAPGVISGQLEPNNAFSVAQYFTAIVNFFSWKKTNTAAFSSLNVSLGRFNAFSRLMVQWDKIQQTKALKIVKSHHYFSIKNLTVRTPEGKTLLKDSNINIPIGKTTVIQGPSGVGKTTLFRCLADLWPYVDGELMLPGDKKNQGVKIYYIPQQPYFPARTTLIDAIAYPNENQPSRIERQKIVLLMKQLGFKQETIKLLNKKDDWDKRLSGGEKQRVAIISAIIKNPDILFMDEGINGLDPKTKSLVEDALKMHLKGKTIVAIDHHANEVDTNPVTPFFDYAMKMKKVKEHDTRATLSIARYKAR